MKKKKAKRSQSTRRRFKKFIDRTFQKRPKSNWAQIVSAIGATAALLGILAQANIIRNNAEKANARQVYMAYHDASLRYPEFVEPEYEEIKKEKLKFVQYKTYISHMLFAYEEVLAVENTREWNAALDYDLRYHRNYFCEENDPTFYVMYYAHLRNILFDFKNKNCKD
jgi:hypothetical protein